MTDIVVADIGGTHARFALAKISTSGTVWLETATTLIASDYPCLETAWLAFAARTGRPLPRAGAIAVACPIAGDVLSLTNNPWTIRPRSIAGEIGLDALTFINDFGAVGHAVAKVDQRHFLHSCGPKRGVPKYGVISIIGPAPDLELHKSCAEAVTGRRNAPWPSRWRISTGWP